MIRCLEFLEVTTVEGKPVYRCLKCGHILGPAGRDYKSYALRREQPLSKAQPRYLPLNTSRYNFREYFCPKCAVLFEVDMALADEPELTSFELKGAGPPG